jgi:hypothetical protein
MEPTRYEATTLEGFIQQLAVSCVGKGYFHYATGRVPDGKDPRALDRKLAARYRLDVSKWSRYRRKRAGLANVRYLRFERFFILLATEGVHRIFEDEAGLIRDCRRIPIKFGGYSVSSRNGRVHVRIEQEQYNLLKAYLQEFHGGSDCLAPTLLRKRRCGTQVVAPSPRGLESTSPARTGKLPGWCRQTPPGTLPCCSSLSSSVSPLAPRCQS